MTDNITGKTILLICGEFHNYDEEIFKALSSLGAKEVILKRATRLKGSLRDRLNASSIFFFLANPFERYKRTKKWEKELEGITFDVMLCIQSMQFSKGFLKYLKNKNPNIRLILFLWDTFKIQNPRYFDYLPLFDLIYSFDRDDAQKYGFRYFPDFYLEGEKPSGRLRFDVAFVGTMNAVNYKYRSRLVYCIDRFCKKNGLTSLLYLKYADFNKESKSRIKLLWHKITRWRYIRWTEIYERCDFMYSEAISLSAFEGIMNDARVIVDINYRDRQGMTINAITALAKGKKLITTNKRMKEEPFYDPNVIYILDEDHPRLDIEFFKSSYTPVNLEELRVDNWLKHILNEQD